MCTRQKNLEDAQIPQTNFEEPRIYLALVAIIKNLGETTSLAGNNSETPQTTKSTAEHQELPICNFLYNEFALTHKRK